ncbi:hypothetical protein GmHk_10G030492 [Glycine max]|uniref:Uncharacterized protein n=1 Tax=Glycine max TaxID=3847 RepID=A0A0R0I7I8_SOYBN|nr:hypothetical protein GYH30_029382 [Glycine max]KAH1231205.1 hypothetical protein GmHk_10G030492 [Glycine max]
MQCQGLQGWSGCSINGTEEYVFNVYESREKAAQSRTIIVGLCSNWTWFDSNAIKSCQQGCAHCVNH